MNRLATGTAICPCPSSGPAGLYLMKTRTPNFRLPLSSLWASLCMTLVLLTLGLYCVRPAAAQYPGGGYPGGGYPGGGYPGGGWTVTDQAGNALDTDPNGYKLRGKMTGSATPTGAYQDILALSQQPNFSMGFPFTPCPPSYQGWLVTGAPDSAYDPDHIWTTVQAYNNAGGNGWLGQPYNKNINGSITANTGATLWAVFQWNGSQPPVDHLDLLLRTTVSASASASTYGSPAQPGGSATATATDSTFNETATASSDGSGGGVPLVTGRHLLRVPVDPNTGKAQASLGGTTTATATADVPYGVMGPYPGTTSGNYYQQTNGPAGANASASIGATASIDSREVTISSPTIEDAYHKGASARNGSDRFLDIRDSPTGSMSVDSAVTTSGGDFVISPSVIGDAFTANALGFQHPYYTWSIPTAGGRVGQYTQQYLGVESDQYVTIPVNINFGKDVTRFPVKSVLKVDVRDSDNVTGSNTYNVTWHLPVDSWSRISSVPTTNRMYPNSGTDPDGKTSIEPNRTVYYTIPTPEVDVTGPAVKTVSVFLAGAGAAAPMLLPETIATGPVGIATVSLLAAGSVITGFLVPPDPGHDYGHTNYVDYVFAVGQQQAINNGGAGIQRFNPTLVDQALAEMTRLQNKYGSGWQSHWNEDHYFSQNFGSMSVTAQAGRYCQLNTYTGDSYDQHGYVGPTTDSLVRDLDPFYVETWQYTGG